MIWRYTIHDGNLPIGETDSSGEVTRWFVRGVGIAEGTGDMAAEIIGPDSGSAKFVYYLCNHRGDTLIVLDENGAVEKQIRYDAFGNVKEQTGTFSPRYTFSTKEYLSDAELYLYAYRVYDPIAGRWTQRDPIDYQDSINLYQFCGNNPVNGTDVDGRFWRDFFNSLPIVGTIMNTGTSPDGSYMSDYKFNGNIAVQATGKSIKDSATMGIHTGISTIVAFLTVGCPIVAGVLGADGILNLGVTLSKHGKIQEGAESALALQQKINERRLENGEAPLETLTDDELPEYLKHESQKKEEPNE